MTLLAPWALWFSLLGAAIVGLYLLKIKRRRQVVPALDFWLRLAGRTKVHSLFDRLKRLLSMMLWLLIAACMVVALGDPILALGSVKPQSIAVIIDNSASMQTVEGATSQETRLAQAISALDTLTRRRPVSDRWLLVEAGRDPRVLVPWTRDRKALNAAAQTMAPFLGRGDLPTAVALAGQLLEGKPDPLIVVLSDGARGTVARLAENDPRIVHWPIGATRDNLGITRLAVRRHSQQSNHHVLIGVANESTEAIDTQVTLSIDGRTHGVEIVRVEPEATWERTIVIEAPEGGVLRATLERPDRLAVDDEAHAILPPIRPAVVWLVSPGDEAYFFEQALGAMEELVSAEESLTLTLAQYEAALSSLARPDSPLRAPDLVLFNNAVPQRFPARGRSIVVNALPEGLPFEEIGTLEAPRLMVAPRDHPLTRYLTLNGVRVREAKRLRATDRATALVHSAEGDPLIVLHESPDRQTLLVAFDVLESDLPFRNAFPLFLRNAVAYLHSESPPWLKPSHGIGEPIAPLRTLAPGATSATCAWMRGTTIETTEIPVERGLFAAPGSATSAALRIGVGDEVAFTAVNLCDEDESRIAPAAGEDPASRLALSETLFGAMPWVALAIAALGLVALEWLTYSFRWTE